MNLDSLTATFRSFTKHKSYTFINVSGLAVALSACILLSGYVQKELSYDTSHEHSGLTYRLVDGMRLDAAFPPSAITPEGWLPTLLANVPELAAGVRVRPLTRRAPLVQQGDQRFYEFRIVQSDPAFFDVFSYEFLEGDARTALTAPDAVVLTAATARKYFGERYPIGQLLSFEEMGDFRVTGVVAEPSAPSSFPFDFLMPFVTPPINQLWTHNFLVVQADVEIPVLEQKLSVQLQALFAEAVYAPRQAFNISLQPLTDIHLHSDLQFEFGPNSDIVYVYILSIVGFFILLVAAINFMNLTIARSAQRAREVGLRKVLGAQRSQLIKQFLGEALVFAMIALLIAWALVLSVGSSFESWTGRTSMELFGLNQLAMWTGIAGAIGFGAGIYPAFVLSAFRPSITLSGLMMTGPSGVRFRQIMVILQFTISIALIASTAIIFEQLDYFRNKPLGFEKEQVVYLNAQAFRERTDVAREAFLQSANVQSVAFAQALPAQMERMASLVYQVEGLTDTQIIRTFAVDEGFIETLDIEVLEGRAFSSDFSTDATAFVINQAAKDAFGWETAIGKTIEEVNQDWSGQVIGVVNDFHFTSLDQTIEPVVIHLVPPVWFNVVVLRVNAAQIANTLEFLQQQWQQLAPDYPFEYTFLDSTFDQLHRDEEQLGRVFAAFAVLAILVASLGLFALASYTIIQRTKEVGVRKVVGASVLEIVFLLSKDFTKLVLIAFLIATPISFLTMQQWLQSFAYRVDINLGTFLVSGLLALTIALLTVSYQAVLAARSNPIEALRYE